MGNEKAEQSVMNLAVELMGEAEAERWYHETHLSSTGGMTAEEAVEAGKAGHVLTGLYDYKKRIEERS